MLANRGSASEPRQVDLGMVRWMPHSPNTRPDASPSTLPAAPSASVCRRRTARRSAARDVAGGLVVGGRVLAALLSLAVLVSAGVAWARYRQFQADIPHINAIVDSAKPGKDVDVKDQNILILGNDDRETASDAELSELGTTRDGAASTRTR